MILSTQGSCVAFSNIREKFHCSLAVRLPVLAPARFDFGADGIYSGGKEPPK